MDVELRATSGDQLSAFQQYYRDNGIDVTLTRLSRLTETTVGTGYDLTPEQREALALALAYHEGYYAEPRETDQETLAAELDITRQALSARLRRGYRNLIENTIVHGPIDDG